MQASGGLVAPPSARCTWSTSWLDRDFWPQAVADLARPRTMKDESYLTTEALVASLQETESAPGTSGEPPHRLKRRGLRVVVWLRRYPA